MKYNRAEIILQHQQEAIYFLKDADPIIRSDFDIYLKGKQLIYVMDKCESEDINIKNPFILHIDPIHQSDLPDFRKQFGFDNFDFKFEKIVFYDGQRCIVIRYLPLYDIAEIRTGQYFENGLIWSETFTLTRHN